jgi:hypothetical protein
LDLLSLTAEKNRAYMQQTNGKFYRVTNTNFYPPYRDGYIIISQD